ncbi:hypothetical protein, partial [Corynebacterium amycolatum]|uniref:hypothetical protein n=1 Tax=Corynebacterium amycolatum TaxID=43765 RepID=UPI003756D7AC
ATCQRPSEIRRAHRGLSFWFTLHLTCDVLDELLKLAHNALVILIESDQVFQSPSGDELLPIPMPA